MNSIAIEESDDERSIVTPDLRLRFRRAGDRWTHAIDIRPGPWQNLADAMEATDDEPTASPRATYQGIHLQRHPEGAVALAVGQSGPHHFSASFRVTYEAYRRLHYAKADIIQDRSESLVSIDIAQRCRTECGLPEVRYFVHTPPVHTYLSQSESPEEWATCLVWEAAVPKNYDVAVGGFGTTPATRLVMRERPPSGYEVRIVPAQPEIQPTNRLVYAWAHRRVSVFKRQSDEDLERPWTMAMEPGVVAPEWTFRSFPA